MIDTLISEFDKCLRTVMTSARSVRPHPSNAGVVPLTNTEKRHAAALMRINHTGEVCAQALYNGQALTAHDPAIAKTLQQASQEETEHLAWCEKRINELGGRKSLLNPLWYAGSFALGAFAGAIGDKWSLGFLAETEHQVEKHLESHLDKLPEHDAESRAVVEQMKQDEAQHALTAFELGAAILPTPIQLAMRLSSKLMTSTTYYV